MRTPRRITDNNARRVAEDLLKQIDKVKTDLNVESESLESKLAITKLKNVSTITTGGLSSYTGDVKILADKINEILNAINK
tara:strand:+ start:827 stop:1069 length:243 start_codon:yes stop_codon:yes gene_type:complete